MSTDEKPKPHVSDYEFWRRPEDDPQIAVCRGGFEWPVNPDIQKAFEEAQKTGGWVAPTVPLDVNGEAIGEAPPAPHDPGQTWPAGTWLKKERDPEPPSWDEELYHWWVETARGDIRGSLDKIVSYGGRGAAYDLIATGHDLAALNGRKVGDEEAAELAVLSYLASKVNRMWAAAIDGRRGSDDTLLDISYYSFMARRIRAVGGWPIGTDNKENTAP